MMAEVSSFFFSAIFGYLALRGDAIDAYDAYDATRKPLL